MAAKHVVANPEALQRRLFEDNVFATFSHPNSFAGYLALLLPVAIVAGAVLLLRGGGGGGAPPPRGLVESIFQDDDHLIYSPTATVARTLDTLRALGVDRVRLTILWKAIAPDPTAPTPPAGFVANDPAAYAAAAWAPYDRVVELARARGIGVDFNLTAPGPLWAMQPTADSRVSDHFRPSAPAFGDFVAAVGKRYSGRYVATSQGAGPGTRVPRVDFWTIWNEPNQPGWLAPQRATFSGRPVPAAPVLYRGYVDAAYRALVQSGHGPGRDTVLIGELAPEGNEKPGAESPIPALSFLRTLYCVDGSYRPLRGEAAVAVGCPLIGGPSGFVRAHPSLFDATGVAHHPYSFFLAPGVSLPDPNFVPISNLGRLEGALDRTFTAYGVHRSLPLYLTEYGYETNPPDPYRGVSLRQQSLYLNQAQYLAWRDPRVRAMAQFLLLDSRPNRAAPRGSARYWPTFQTGLEFASGKPKLAMNSYRLPIFVPDPTTRPGSDLTVWAMLRLARNRSAQSALLQWRPLKGAYRTLARLSTSDPSGFLDTAVKLPGAGAVRIQWTAPNGTTVRSRSVGVS